MLHMGRRERWNTIVLKVGTSIFLSGNGQHVYVVTLNNKNFKQAVSFSFAGLSKDDVVVHCWGYSGRIFVMDIETEK